MLTLYASLVTCCWLCGSNGFNAITNVTSQNTVFSQAKMIAIWKNVIQQI